MPLDCITISPDPKVRKAGIDLSKKLIDLSSEAGARVFGGVIYCGWGYLTCKMRTEDEWKWGLESTWAIAEYALKQAPDLVMGIERLTVSSHFS